MQLDSFTSGFIMILFGLIIFYWLVKAAVKRGINESKLFSDNDRKISLSYEQQEQKGNEKVDTHSITNSMIETKDIIFVIIMMVFVGIILWFQGVRWYELLIIGIPFAVLLALAIVRIFRRGGSG